MTNDFETVEAVAATYIRRLVDAGYQPEDIAAAFVVEGVALTRALDGDEATAAWLEKIAEHLNG